MQCWNSQFNGINKSPETDFERLSNVPINTFLFICLHDYIGPSSPLEQLCLNIIHHSNTEERVRACDLGVETLEGFACSFLS